MISGPLDWLAIFRTVRHAKIASLFFYQLQSLGLNGGIPPAIRCRFERYYYKIAFQNIRIFDQLIKVTQLLAEAKVDVIVLKGAALQAEVWPNLSLREMADIDLLVRSGDLNVAERSLQKAGYLPMEYYRPAEYYRKYHHHLVPYFNPKAAYRLPIEIHHNIKQPTVPPMLDMYDFWESSRSITFNNSTLYVLSPENLLVHLCMHVAFNKLFLSHIRYLIDISHTVSHFASTIQWDHIIKTAKTLPLANYIYYPFYFSKILFRAPIPQNVLNQIGTRVSVKFISHHLLRYLVKRYSLIYFPESPLIPVYKLKLVCRDIITAAATTEKFKTLWHEFCDPKELGNRLSRAMHA